MGSQHKHIPVQKKDGLKSPSNNHQEDKNGIHKLIQIVSKGGKKQPELVP